MRNKNNPMRLRRLGRRPQKNTRLKSATAPRERRAARRRTLRAVAPFRRGAGAELSPSARFASRMGLRLFRPAGARKKLKGRFLREGFSETRQVSEAWSHVASKKHPCASASIRGFKNLRKSANSAGENFLRKDFDKRQECRFPSNAVFLCV